MSRHGRHPGRIRRDRFRFFTRLRWCCKWTAAVVCVVVLMVVVVTPFVSVSYVFPATGGRWDQVGVGLTNGALLIGHPPPPDQMPGTVRVVRIEHPTFAWRYVHHVDANNMIFYLPLVWPLLGVVVVTAGLWSPELLGLRRHHPGSCRDCGYDLTGNTSGQCPECGVDVE